MNRATFSYVTVFLVILALLSLSWGPEFRITGFAVFEDSGQADFDEGTYDSTEYNSIGEFIELTSGSLNGTYTSRVFDAGGSASWNSIISEKEITEGYENYLLSAFHLDVNRTEVFDLDGAYYLADMKDSSKNFYLNFSSNLLNNSVLKIYAKRDNGITIGIYSQSDPSGSSPLGTLTVASETGDWYNVTLNIDTPTDAIWLGEGIGSGIDPKDEFDYIYADVLTGSNLTFQVRACSLPDCSDADFAGPDGGTDTYFSESNYDLGLTGRYFQYMFYFESWDSNQGPRLFNVSLDYTVSSQAPATPQLSSPANNSFQREGHALLNAASTNPNGDDITYWFYGDGELINETTLPSGADATYNWTGLGLGTHNWSVKAGDVTGNSSMSESRYLTVYTTEPTGEVVYMTKTCSDYGCPDEYTCDAGTGMCTRTNYTGGVVYVENETRISELEQRISELEVLSSYLQAKLNVAEEQKNMQLRELQITKDYLTAREGQVYIISPFGVVLLIILVWTSFSIGYGLKEARGRRKAINTSKNKR